MPVGIERTAEPFTGTLLAGSRILLARARPDTSSLERQLRQYGAQVEVVEDGPAVLERLTRPASDCLPIDIALLDANLPTLDGPTTARHLREQGITIPLIALGDEFVFNAEQRCRNAGFDDHLEAPIGPATLAATCARWFGLGSTSQRCAG